MIWEFIIYVSVVIRCVKLVDVYIAVDNYVWFQVLKSAHKQIDPGSRWAEIFTNPSPTSVRGVVFSNQKN